MEFASNGKFLKLLDTYSVEPSGVSSPSPKLNQVRGSPIRLRSGLLRKLSVVPLSKESQKHAIYLLLCAFYMAQVANYNISLKCFLRNPNGEILILKTPKDSSFLGFYDFPGGRIDENEFNITYRDILKREVLEETGITDVTISDKVVAIGRHRVDAKFRKSIQEDNFIFFIFFEGYIHKNKSIQLSGEHSKFQWVRLENIVLEDYFISGYLEAAKMYLSSLNS